MRIDTQSAAMQRIFPLAEASVLLLLMAVFVFKALIPAWGELRSDFPNYYLIARLLREHYPMDRIYDWIWLQRIKDRWSIPVPLVGFPGATPFSVLPVLPLTWMDALSAKRIWLAENFSVLGAALYGMKKITGSDTHRIAFLAFLAVIPLRNEFLLGQLHLLVLSLLVLAYWLNERDRWLGCGLALAIAASLKIYPIFFALFFLRKRQWKTAVVLAASTLAILAICFCIFGAPVMRIFLIEQLPRAMHGEAVDPFSLTGPSASSLFHRIFLTQPQLNPRPLIASPLLYALLYPLWQLALLGATLLSISSRETEKRLGSLEWATWICLLLTLSTLPASYHFVALIFVAVVAMNAMQSPWRKAILLACYFAACNIHPFLPPQNLLSALAVDYLRYWALLGMMACLLLELRAHSIRTPVLRRAWPRATVVMTLAGFASIWCVGAATTYAHERSIASAELPMERADLSYARFTPRRAGSHLLTVAMFDRGYRVQDEDGNSYPAGGNGGDEDQLAIAASPLVDRFWIEAEGNGGPRLMELPLPLKSAAAGPIATIPDAESPALSPDGRCLVFLREVKGIGSAWMVDLDEEGRVKNAPLPISPIGMDIWDAAFGASGEVYFSAATNGVSHLYVSSHSGGEPHRILAQGDAMDSPIMIPGSDLLVYRQRNRSYWRLFATDLRHGGATQLTFGDCNAYSPAWSDAATLLYSSDCGRGMGLGEVAIVHPMPSLGEPDNLSSSAVPANRRQGKAQR